ncbi:hypothetical protein Micbo1qcDRAFT_27800 [Microdochium bolleyi]|uniref:Uncharacterized protein n=1 Tax=Microdochium bolleyi TaxID=196109 RepID=A0A136JER5_9PEZI|nr:hypothetical protein Micbo1qcDRAFT_27800 [Microdochium bolleyi]
MHAPCRMTIKERALSFAFQYADVCLAAKLHTSSVVRGSTSASCRTHSLQQAAQALFRSETGTCSIRWRGAVSDTTRTTRTRTCEQFRKGTLESKSPLSTSISADCLKQ